MFYWMLLIFSLCSLVTLSGGFPIGGLHDKHHRVTTPRRLASTLQVVSGSEDLQETLRKCALERSVSAERVIETLEYLEQNNASSDTRAIRQEDVTGTFSLVFSSSVAQLPLVGNWLGGYLPIRETIQFDFDACSMSLAVETLPFLPTIDIIGEELAWDAESSTLSYKVKGKDNESQWKILYADETLVAAKSSVTGLNVIRRIA